MQDSCEKPGRKIASIMEKPQNILVTVLCGNLLVNFVSSAMLTEILLKRWMEWGHVVSIGIITPIIILFCEITPKLVAIRIYHRMVYYVYPLIKFFHVIFYPLRRVLLCITDLMVSISGIKADNSSLTEEELDMAVRISERDGIIDPREGEIIGNVRRFSKKTASNVMFPRNSAVFIPSGAGIDEAMGIFLESKVIRAPIYEGNVDHIVGMIDSRDLISSYLGYKKSANINKFIREIQFYPESRELKDLLYDFLREGIQIAVIVDEFGGTAGVVTLNKIISSLMGRRLNKWEIDIKQDRRETEEGCCLIPGEMQLEDFNFHFNESLHSENADSIGGYIIEKLEHFPRRGEIIQINKYRLMVRYVRKKKIETIEVSRKDG
jgi:CBS domain containing-hemolysin-like protein